VVDPLRVEDRTGAHLASPELQTAWNAKRYTVNDNLQNQTVQSLKERLCVAPFRWSGETQAGGSKWQADDFINLFSMPAIHISEPVTETSQADHQEPKMEVDELSASNRDGI